MGSDVSRRWWTRRRAVVVVVCTVLVLIPAALIAFVLARGSVVSGRLVTPDGLPVSGALLVVTSSGERGALGSQSTVTDERGGFVVEVPGDATLHDIDVVAPEWGVRTRLMIASGLVWRLRRLGAGSAHVVQPMSSAVARVEDADGRPIPAALCGVVVRQDGTVHSARETADDEGLAIVPLPVEDATTATIDASATGYEPRTVETRQSVQRGATLHIGPALVRLARTGRARVSVTADGKRVPGVRVSTVAVAAPGELVPWLGTDPLQPQYLASRSFASGGWAQRSDGSWLIGVTHSTTTSVDGVYELTAPVPCSEMWVLVEAPGRPLTAVSVPHAERESAPGEDIVCDVPLPPAPDPVRLRFQDADGNALAGVRLILQDHRLSSHAQMNSPELTTDAEGRIVTTFVAEGGLYGVFVPSGGYQPTELRLSDGLTVTLTERK